MPNRRHDILLVLGAMVLVLFIVGTVVLAVTFSHEKSKGPVVSGVGPNSSPAQKSKIEGISVSKGGIYAATNFSFQIPTGSSSFSDTTTPGGLEQVSFDWNTRSVSIISNPPNAGAFLPAMLSGSSLIQTPTGQAYIQQTKEQTILTSVIGGRITSVSVIGSDSYTLALQILGSIKG